MKKFLLLTTLILLSINIKAQDTITYDDPLAAYLTVYGCPSHSQTFDETSLCFGIGLSFYYDLYEDLSLRTEMALNQTFISDYSVHPSFSIGFEYYFYKWLYFYMDFVPKIDIHGQGHQVYGDYLSLYSELSIGLGYWIELPNKNNLSIEAGLYKEFTFVNTDRTGYHDDFGYSIMLGYHYQIN